MESIEPLVGIFKHFYRKEISSKKFMHFKEFEIQTTQIFFNAIDLPIG